MRNVKKLGVSGDEATRCYVLCFIQNHGFLGVRSDVIGMGNYVLCFIQNHGFLGVRSDVIGMGK